MIVKTKTAKLRNTSGVVITGTHYTNLKSEMGNQKEEQEKREENERLSARDGSSGHSGNRKGGSLAAGLGAFPSASTDFRI